MVYFKDKVVKVLSVEFGSKAGDYVMVSLDTDDQEDGQVITNTENKIPSSGVKHLRAEIKMLPDADTISLNDTLKLFTHSA